MFQRLSRVNFIAQQATGHCAKMDALRKAINCTFQSAVGLHAIFITDRDCVMIMKTAFDGAPEVALRPMLLASHAAALEHSTKLGLGEVKHLAANFSQHRVVMLNFDTILVTFIGSSDLNSALLVALRGELAPIIAQINELVFN